MERLGRVGVHVHGAAPAAPAAASSLASCDLLITGGRVIDPANQIDQENCDVAVRIIDYAVSALLSCLCAALLSLRASVVSAVCCGTWQGRG
eukprot:COSAG02_NODE_177_length_31154_cov_32.205152_9_plen_92_part_00